MSKKFLVDAARRVVERLVLDWQLEPDRWERERDVQVELCSRLNQLYRILGSDTVSATENGKMFNYNRAACEPCVEYTYRDKKKYLCYPDVVIWDELLNSKDTQVSFENWPILWACEIKYTFSEPDNWDVEKLEYLIQQTKVEFGCWLMLIKKEAKGHASIVWQKDKANGKLWACKAYLPIATSKK